MRHWKKLRREVLDAPSLEVFRLDEALVKLIQQKQSLPMARDCNWMVLKVPFQPSHSMITLSSEYIHF